MQKRINGVRGRDAGGVGVAEVDGDAEGDGGDEETGVCQYGFGDCSLGSVDGESKHDDDASRASGDGEGEGIEGFVVELLALVRRDGGKGGGGRFLRVG